MCSSKARQKPNELRECGRRCCPVLPHVLLPVGPVLVLQVPVLLLVGQREIRHSVACSCQPMTHPVKPWLLTKLTVADEQLLQLPAVCVRQCLQQQRVLQQMLHLLLSLHLLLQLLAVCLQRCKGGSSADRDATVLALLFLLHAQLLLQQLPLLHHLCGSPLQQVQHVVQACHQLLLLVCCCC